MSSQTPHPLQDVQTSGSSNPRSSYSEDQKKNQNQQSDLHLSGLSDDPLDPTNQERQVAGPRKPKRPKLRVAGPITPEQRDWAYAMEAERQKRKREASEAERLAREAEQLAERSAWVEREIREAVESRIGFYESVENPRPSPWPRRRWQQQQQQQQRGHGQPRRNNQGWRGRRQRGASQSQQGQPRQDYRQANRARGSRRGRGSELGDNQERGGSGAGEEPDGNPMDTEYIMQNYT